MRTIFAVAAFTLALIGAASADTVTINYYSIAAPLVTPADGTNDFGVCCSSGPATLPNVTVGDSLLGGLPVSIGGPFPVVMVNVSGQIGWWTPSPATGITFQGTSITSVPFTNDAFFSPLGTGLNNNSAFQTATLSGILHGTGLDTQLTVRADDDALVYVDGKYVGGVLGVHQATSAIIDLGLLTGPESIEIFYADRAHTDAVLEFSLAGATVTAGVPEPSTWAMMILGFFGLGFLAYRRKNGTLRTA
jgi:hypothetical protein